jgi:hypothetical protein
VDRGSMQGYGKRLEGGVGKDGHGCDVERVMLTLDRLVDLPQLSSTLPELTRLPSQVSFHCSVLENNADLFLSPLPIPPCFFHISPILPIADEYTSLGRNNTVIDEFSNRLCSSCSHTQPLLRSLPSSRAELPVLRLAVMSRRLVVS